MRNLKRALSLTLASVMLLGMMVVGSSAAAGYDDVKETDNVEAIEVLQTVGIMVGDERGFGPDRAVNRAEMAVIMGLLLNLDYNYYTATCPFDDVYDWARGWVGACAANGIVSGRGDGVYDPGATVTAVEAASMLMRALGYFKYASDYANGFEVSTVLQGNNIRIFDGVGSSATEPMTRNQVAQMVLNALQSGMVQADGNTLNYFDTNGQVIATSGKVNYVYVTSNKTFARAISDVRATAMGSANDAYIVELGEQLYNGDLKLYDNREDDFGRPARNWEYKGESIGDYVKKELLKQEYTTEVTGKDLYDLLGSDTVKNYDFVITIDGVNVKDKTGTTTNKTVLEKDGDGDADSYFDESFMARTYKSGVGATGNGVLTQVFVDPDRYELDNGGYRGEVHVAVINTFLAKATKDYSTKDDDITLEVFALQHEGSGDNAVYFKAKEAYEVDDKQSERLDVNGEDFDIADMKKDDIVLVNVANGEIKTISQPEVLSAVTLSAFSQNSYVVSEGTQYDYAAAAEYDPEVLDYYTSMGATQQLKDTDYNVYLDKYGYLVGIDVVDAVKNYIFLTGIDLGTSNLKNKTANAAGILTDGTFIEFSMDMKDSEQADESEFSAHPLWNTWCTYTVDKDGVYTLTEVKSLAAMNAVGSKEKAGQYHDANYSNRDIDDKHVSLKSSDGSTYVYGNDDTVYLVAELEDVTSDTDFAANTVKMPDNTTNALEVTAGRHKVGIISGVDSVATGIANVNLNTWTAAEIENEVGALRAYSGNVYTLFDDDGYVIAAVVVGEDDGTTKNLVYSNKDKIAKESYNATDDEWTWERVVISNGEEVTLTEKGDKTSVLKDMKENTWYEINFKADGTVKDSKYAYYMEDTKHVGATAAAASKRALDLTTSANKADAHDFVDTIEYVENAINESDKTTVLYEQVWGIGKGDATSSNSVQLVEKNAPSLKGSTLYVNTDANKGFYVSSDVKSVLIQKNDGKSSTTFGSGTSDLESILEDLNFDAATNSYCFKISAILTNGRATTVIIHDWTETGAKGNGGGGNNDVPPTDTWTLTLTGPDFTGAVVYANSKTVTADTFTVGAAGDTFTYKIDKNAPVVIQLADSKTVADYSDKTPEGVAYTQTASSKRISLTMSNNATLTGLKTADDALFAVNFLDGTQPDKWYGVQVVYAGNTQYSNLVELTTSPVVSRDENTYYVKAGSNVAAVSLKQASGTYGGNTYAFAAGSPSETVRAAGDAMFVQASKSYNIYDSTGASTSRTYTNIIDFQNVLSGSIYIMGAEKVTLKGGDTNNTDSVAPIRLGWGYGDPANKNNDQVYYVRVNTALPKMDLTGNRAGTLKDLSGVIVSKKGTTTYAVADDISNGGYVIAANAGTAGYELSAGYKVTLNNVTAKYDLSSPTSLGTLGDADTAVTSGQIALKDTKLALTVDSTVAANVIEGQEVVNADTAVDTTTAADVGSADKTFYAAGKITLTNGQIKSLVVDGRPAGDSSSAQDVVFAVPGKTVSVKGNVTTDGAVINISGTGAPTLTLGDSANGFDGASATFTTNGKDITLGSST